MRSLQVRSIDEISQIGIHVVQLPPNASEVAYRNAFRQRSEIEFAELDEILPLTQTTTAPNDPYYSSQWHLEKISTPKAWSVTTGSPGVIIAIADTGVDPTHPDLAGKMVAGWNVNDGNSNTSDVHGHGTKVAGAAAAATNNAIGVASIAWNCWIMPVRVSGPDGLAYTSTIAKGITWAADHGARVVNVSYDATSNTTVSAAAKYMNSKGGVVTMSAGNSGVVDTFADDPAIITVGATDPNDVMYSWSDRGTPTDLVAPGCVITTVRGGGYGSACGTSFSAPVVAGVAALVLSAKPGLSSAQVTSTLRSSADDLGAAGWDTTFGAGRVNAERAVSGSTSITPGDTQAPSVSITSPTAGTVLAGTVTVQIAASDNVGITSIITTANGTTIGSAATFLWNTTTWADGTYTLAVRVKDAAGNTSSASIAVSVRNMKDSTAPVVSITSPLGGTIVTGNVTLAVKATDNIGVVTVQYYSDGVLIGTATAAPFSIKWQTRYTPVGAHSLTARAFDAAGNAGVSVPVAVTVKR
jgi:subtilisin family serine protease